VKSVCIKTNNQEIIEYLINTFEKLPINLCISNCKFKTYDNVIIHDIDRNESEFYEVVAIVLKSAIEKFYEKDIIKKILKQNYFYLNDMEQEYVLKISNQIMNLPDNKIGYKNKLLKNLVKKYIIENKSIVLDGFMNFRVKEYKDLLDNIVEVSVVSFLELTSF
jgi:hypothetical protein